MLAVSLKVDFIVMQKDQSARDRRPTRVNYFPSLLWILPVLTWIWTSCTCPQGQYSQCFSHHAFHWIPRVSRPWTQADGPHKPGALKPTSIRLKSYTDRILKCCGSASFRVTHYKTNRLEDFTFFVRNTKNKIILSYPMRQAGSNLSAVSQQGKEAD